ncbi:MAG: peptidoglycan DD-metalloendopeptidase family protein [Polyangiales bacterium]
MKLSEQPPREALRPLRPLPSIDIPLLREERSAVRNRRLVRIGLTAGALLALGGGVTLAARSLAHKQGTRDAQAGAVAHPRADVPTAPPAALLAAQRKPSSAQPVVELPPPRVPGRFERRFGKALSFYDALRKAGLDVPEANAVIAALDGQLDFRRAHAEDLLVVERGEGAYLSRFEYRASATQRFEAVRVETGALEGRKVELPIVTTRVSRGGVVAGSLGDALEGLSLGRALTGLFADVFAGRVNFSTDTRSGDAFRVVVDEERVDGALLRYGAVHALEYRGDKVGVLRAYWHESKQTEGDYFDAAGRALHGGWLRTPVRYERISSPFGMRFHPVLKRKQLHAGIDYAAGSGTPVRAAAAGAVRFAGAHGPSGNLVAIRHPHGYETFYAHLSRIAPEIKPGARIKQREIIAYVGSSGRSTGPHLHFALKRGGRVIDPESQLNGPGLPLPPHELPAFKERVDALSAALDAIPLEQPAPVTPTPEPEPPPIDFGEDEL